jgi:hypothetical protein
MLLCTHCESDGREAGVQHASSQALSRGVFLQSVAGCAVHKNGELHCGTSVGRWVVALGSVWAAVSRCHDDTPQRSSLMKHDIVRQ